jgi:hypothetical protein
MTGGSKAYILILRLLRTSLAWHTPTQSTSPKVSIGDAVAAMSMPYLVGKFAMRPIRDYLKSHLPSGFPYKQDYSLQLLAKTLALPGLSVSLLYCLLCRSRGLRSLGGKQYPTTVVRHS